MYWSEGGLAALYRGIIPTVAGVAPYVCADKVYIVVGTCTDMQAGRAKFHGLRNGSHLCNTRRGEESFNHGQVGCRGRFRSCSANHYISVVSTFIEVGLFQSILKKIAVTFYGGGFRSIP